MNKSSIIYKLCWLLVIIGALNWGLLGAFGFNLVHAIVQAWPAVERIVYVLVGLSALVVLYVCCIAKK